MGDGLAVLDRLSDAATVRRAFGEPIERDGSLLIPVAAVAGGGGGGDGRRQQPETHEQSDGAGAGFGLRVTPSGVFVVRDGRVRWQPAVDVNRVVLGGQVVAVVALVVLRSILRTRARHGR